MAPILSFFLGWKSLKSLQPLGFPGVGILLDLQNMIMIEIDIPHLYRDLDLQLQVLPYLFT